MMFKLLLLGVLFFAKAVVSSDIIPDKFSFHAEVESKDKTCSGVLITENYVLTAASCVFGLSDVNVSLGNDIANYGSPSSQYFYSTHFSVLEGFATVAGTPSYLNNIALVKLPRPAVLSNKVQLGKLMSSQDEGQFEGQFVDISGYLEQDEYAIRNATAQVEDKDTCKDFSSSFILRHQSSFCITTQTGVSYVGIGNAISIDNKVLGLTTQVLECSGYCLSRYLVINLKPFLNWMSKKMNVPIEQFTSPANKEPNNFYIIIKTIQEKLNALENTFTDNNQIIEKQLKDIVDKVERHAIKDNDFNFKFQMKIDDCLNTALSNTFVGNSRFNKVKNALDERESEHLKLQEKLDELLNAVQKITLRLEECKKEKKLNITHELDKLFDKINIKLDIHISKENEARLQFQEEVSELVRTVEKNSLKENLHFGVIKNLLDQQKMNMDKHIFQEATQFNSTYAN